MKVEVAVLGSPSLIVLMVSVDVKQHLNIGHHRAQKLCESRGGRPWLPVANSPYGERLCGRKATFEEVLQADARAHPAQWTRWTVAGP